MESQGYQYEGAEASFELLARRSLPDYQAPFELRDFLVVVRRHSDPERGEAGEMLAEAAVKVRVGDDTMHTVAEGDGPVNALDLAVRKALTEFHPRPAEREAGRLQGAHRRQPVRRRRPSCASCWNRRTASTRGRPSAARRTSSRQAGWRLSDSLEWWLTRRSR